MAAAVLLSDLRALPDMGTMPAIEIGKLLERVTKGVIAAVEKHGGIVHQYIGGAVVAYWTSDPERAFEAAFAAVSGAGALSSIAVSIGDVSAHDVGPQGAKRSVLVGRAYTRADAILRSVPPGSVGVDLETLSSIPDLLRSRFISNGSIAVAR